MLKMVNQVKQAQDYLKNSYGEEGYKKLVNAFGGNKMKLSNPSVRVVEDGVEYLVRTPQQVEEDLRKLSQIRKDEDFLEHWRRILSYKEPICPKCGEIGSVLRKNSKGKVLGCDRCLAIQGYCEED